MKLIVLPEASAKLADAVEYYEGEEAGLGERLWWEVDDHLRWIAANATLPRLRCRFADEGAAICNSITRGNWIGDS